MYQGLSCFLAATQPLISSLKLTVETLEKGVKYAQSKQERHQSEANVGWKIPPV